MSHACRWTQLTNSPKPGSEDIFGSVQKDLSVHQPEFVRCLWSSLNNLKP